MCIRDRYHTDINTDSDKWAPRFNKWFAENHQDGVLTDVYLDYFFFQQSWYRHSFGTKWQSQLSLLDFTGTAYLPIAHSPDGSPLIEEDYIYKEQLKKWVFEQGGTYYLKDELLMDPLSVVPFCQATKDCRSLLLALDKKLGNQRPYARNHRTQVHSRIEGILSITASQVKQSSARTRGRGTYLSLIHI